jgi:hypothetical protein
MNAFSNTNNSSLFPPMLSFQGSKGNGELLFLSWCSGQHNHVVMIVSFFSLEQWEYLSEGWRTIADTM